MCIREYSVIWEDDVPSDFHFSCSYYKVIKRKEPHVSCAPSTSAHKQPLGMEEALKYPLVVWLTDSVGC